MRRAPSSWRRFFHLHGEPYHVENSVRGIHRAAREGYDAIDLDANVTRDGVMVNTHWSLPMALDGFRSRSGLPRRTRIDQMTWAQASGLRTRDGYVIRRMATQLRVARRVGLERVEVDAKRSRGIAEQSLWDGLMAAKPKGLLVVVKCASTNPDCPRLLAAAKRAGFPTMVLVRGPIPTAWYGVIDYVRGTVTQRKAAS